MSEKTNKILAGTATGRNEPNSFDMVVKMFPDADCLFLSRYDKENGVVTGEPCNNKTGTTWAMAMISSIEEALECKYPLVCSSEEKELVAYLNDHHQSNQKKESVE